MFVVLIGHGTFDGQRGQVQPAGAGHDAGGLRAAAQEAKSQHVVFVNTSSASGPFVEALAAPGRTIVAATRNGAERFATLFGGYFVDALAGTEADTDKNGRISVLEAFNFAKREVGVAYEREGIMVTEHPILSDNGDKTGHADAGRRRQAGPGRLGADARIAGDRRGAAGAIRSCARSTSSGATSSGGSKG